MKPELLNETSEERIHELVDHFVVRGDDHELQDMPPIASFLTLELLRRVHERVVKLINSGVCVMSKHKALACAMCGMTGVSEPPDERDTDKIGNHIDIWLRRNYIDVERKLCRNTRNKETLEKKRAELRASCCVISAMGRIEEFHGPYHDEHPSTSARDAVRIKKRPPPLVPYTHSLLPPPMSMLDLKEAVLEAQRNAASAESNAKKEQKRSDHQKILVEAVKSRSKRVAVPETEKVALVEMCRAERTRQRVLDRSDWEELHSLRSHTRKTNSELELEALIKNFAMALSFFDRYQQRGIRSVDAIHHHLRAVVDTQAQLNWLREQIEMRVIGLGWIEFKTHWSSGADENVGSVADLTSQLKEILEEEVERQIPEAAPAPIMQRKTFKQLGLPTAQAELLAEQRLSQSVEQLRAAAVLERQRLEANGILDIVGDLQPENPPPLTEELVGRKLEIHWRYWRPAEPGERGTKKQVFIWCQGTVEKVADGIIRKSKRSKEALPAGAVRIRWPADSDFEERETLVWSILNPSDWCKDVHLGWRWAPSELERLAREATATTNAICANRG